MSLFVFNFVALFLVFQEGSATLHLNHRLIKMNCPKVVVDPSGRGNFTTIQAAINSVPSNNRRWICIHVNKGLYREQVTIPFDKPFIFLEGSGREKTQVVWNAHDSIATSATFTSQADNLIVKRLTFMNSYNYPLRVSRNPMRPALAAMIEGDKSAFYRCRFIGLQDTLWDVQGRHYFEQCTIQGAVDFIFGSGQSVYQSCIIRVVAGVLQGPGYITAQGRSNPSETNGFVFKNCNIVGSGKTYLGRPWRAYARVIFYNTYMSDIIVPEGWNPWYSYGREDTLTFDEIDCYGLGSKSSRRVRWANKLNPRLWRMFASISYIARGGWLQYDAREIN